jgi:putative ABC transport system permease protein
MKGGLWGESIRMGLDALWSNKLRTFLTLLGNIVGVMTVIAVVSIIEGMNAYVSEKLVDKGSNVFYVDKIGITFDEEAFFDLLKRKDLVAEDALAMRGASPTILQAAATVGTTKNVRARRRNLSGVQIIGSTDEHPEVEKYELASGRMLTREDNERRRLVCAIGHDISRQVFPDQDPVGKTLRIGDHNFTVIGAFDKRGSLLGQSQDNFVVVPITTFRKVWGIHDSATLVIRSTGPETLAPAQDDATAILRVRRHIKPGKANDFEILTSDVFLQLYKSFTGGAFLVMIGVASISLLVGGIVIMNIMLVSVTERTREVGVRKAIGARRMDILRQFLIEAVVLAAIGGAIGCALGIGIAKAVEAASPLPAAVRPWAVGLGVGVSSLVGLFFGVYPAVKAARLDPIVALRYE